jgi:metallo-beta-lactamase class B
VPRKAKSNEAKPETNNSASKPRAKKDVTVARPNSKSLPPMQVFDNFYFVGHAGVSAWVLGDEEGYILIDAMTSNEDAEHIIEAGMLKLGLDPNKIKYMVITHGHGDHFGGHRYLREKYGMPFVMGKVDWQLASFLGTHPKFGPPPVMRDGDIAAVGGEKLEAGNVSLDIHLTSGHTMGTISPVFTVKDGDDSYRAALWGGTGFNFGPYASQLKAYAESARRFSENAEQENIEVFFSNHGARDGSVEKMAKLSERKANQEHPFVMGGRARDVYTLLENCALAQYYRLESGAYQAAK